MFLTVEVLGARYHRHEKCVQGRSGQNVFEVTFMAFVIGGGGNKGKLKVCSSWQEI